MKRYKKKDILQAIETLAEANNIILKAVKVNPQGAADALAACQELAIQTGECLEVRGKESAPAVAILEEYCEDIYRMSENIFDAGQLKKISGVIAKKLTRLKHSVSYDLPDDKKEVVFLPYKASMWDSLESVWKAADQDDGTDAYVIPIPYYDKNPDGSFREMHYEGDLYPDYVPITHYSAYDVEERRPDAIYIHNPYDEGNYVTSVEPFYYARNLRQYTDKLVYIPYFVLGEIDPGDQNAINGMKHFCFVPGVMYAHKVVVQSENMRQIYINEFVKEAKRLGLSGEYTDRAVLEKKILGLGSPKMDKVLNTRKDELEIPEEWRRVIEKPDGSRKKIVFYNTSISALLQYNEDMLKKMENVFETFYVNKEDIALLWRPHPLIESTLTSMRPKLWGEYQKIRDRYIRNGWGVYDDTTDMERAVALCDGYYGDMSSVVWLCQAARKVFAIQDVTMLPGQSVMLNWTKIIQYQDRLFILTFDSQSLFEYSYKTGKMKFCARVGKWLGQSFISAVLCQDKIYFAPYEANTIFVYDIKNEKMDCILETKGKNEQKQKYYHTGVCYREKVFFWGHQRSIPFYIDTSNGTLKTISQWSDEFRKIYGYDTFIKTQIDTCIVEDCIWMAINGDNMLLQYNLLSGEYQFWNVGNRKMQYITICYDGEFFWLSGEETCIVRWEKETGDIKEFDDFPKGFMIDTQKGWRELFLCGCLWKEQLYFVPLSANMLIKLDRKTGQMECVMKMSSHHVCYRAEILEDILYIEDYDPDTTKAVTYRIEENNQHQLTSVKWEKENEVNLENLGSGKENHPWFLCSFLKKLEYDDNLNVQTVNVGKHIFEVGAQ